MHAIDAHGVTYAFGEGPLRTEVLRQVSLTVGRGEVVVLRGASGSGKTTLLTLLACLRSLQAGEVTLFGQPLHGTTQAQRVTLRRDSLEESWWEVRAQRLELLLQVETSSTTYSGCREAGSEVARTVTCHGKPEW
ncbi:MAG: ATP-binding cassette domain-containing protein [Myxococcaceae bacterium]|nr:ATP-binding cassette domain-containing protein [Myxococcaceae bacterium]